MGADISSRVGKAVEHLVAASVILATDGEVNVSTSLVDDEGVDLVFHRRGGAATLAVQVKSRTTETSLARKGVFQADVRETTFRARADLAMLFVLVDKSNAAIKCAWLVPSFEFAARALRISDGSILRVRASLAESSNDKWSPYRLRAEELPRSINAWLVADED